MTKIAGFVLRRSDRQATAAFYRELGLTTNEHRHGEGPKHHEVLPLAPDFVVEIYQSSPAFSQDTIMIEVDSLMATLKIAARHKIIPSGDIREGPKMRFVYITDPDKRSLMLIEKK
ncbi:MAG: VOC family protein [bacterium]|nr:VOC family protein [bacterium]